MRIWGKLTCRNEGAKALNTMRYHLNILGWDGFIYIDNDSTDDSVTVVKTAEDVRIKILTTDGRGLNQIYWSQVAHKWLTQHTNCEVVVPVDCDMLWYGITNNTLLIAEDSQILGFLSNNYAFNADSDTCCHAPDYHSKFWKYLTYRRVTPNCQKAILFRKSFANSEFNLFEGDHFLTYHNSMVQLPLIDSIKVYEYPVLSYNDLVRKTVNSGIGRTLSSGIRWVRMQDEKGTYTAQDLDQLSRTGSLHSKWQNFILSPQECISLKNKGGEEFIVDRTLVDINYPTLFSPLDL